MKAVIIGGGASGMMCAAIAARLGTEVVLLEKNEKLGKKLYITGKGRCNLTNRKEPDAFLRAVNSNPKFLYKALNAFSPSDTMEFFESEKLPLKVERGERVFPVSDKASDVIKCLEKVIVKEGATVKLNTAVKAIKTENEKVKSVLTNDGEISCDAVVVATGGLSYSATGSTGDGFRFAKTLGHTVIETVPSLCGLVLNEDDYISLQGLSLKNVGLSAIYDGKCIFCEQGEMLFTHYGISGPLVLTLSGKVNRLDFSKLTLSIDLKPALDEKQLDARLLRDFETFKNKQFGNSLSELLPNSLIDVIIKRSGIDSDKQTNAVTRGERAKLISVLKSMDYSVKGLAPIEEAVITAGGVNVKEINPSTMESRIISGLYFIGEVLDVDANTGGYNLQIAFSSANAAARSLAEKSGI